MFSVPAEAEKAVEKIMKNGWKSRGLAKSQLQKKMEKEGFDIGYIRQVFSDVQELVILQMNARYAEICEKAGVK